MDDFLTGDWIKELEELDRNNSQDQQPETKEQLNERFDRAMDVV